MDLNFKERYKKIMQEEEYGYIPEAPLLVEAEIVDQDEKIFASKAILYNFNLKITVKNGLITFPFVFCRPKKNIKHKTVVCLNFSADVPNKYLPAEEIIDKGWAFVNVFYNDITNDNDDFNDKAAALLKGEGDTAPGKIAMWAWSVMRIIDYLVTRDDVDTKNIAVVGHSRLGKTALVTGAFDERIAFVHSNESGSGGAALFSMRDAESEPISFLLKTFHRWFCKNFAKYSEMEYSLPFDQHYLVSLIAPRVVSIGSAKDDFWANPKAEQYCAIKAGKTWELYGKKGSDIPNEIEVGKNYHNGHVGYYVRRGSHFFSREDWNRFLDFFDSHLNK